MNAALRGSAQMRAELRLGGKLFPAGNADDGQRKVKGFAPLRGVGQAEYFVDWFPGGRFGGRCAGFVPAPKAKIQPVLVAMVNVAMQDEGIDAGKLGSFVIRV